MKTALMISEMGQVPQLLSLLQSRYKGEEPLVVVLDAEVGSRLMQENVPFVSGASYCGDPARRLLRAESLVAWIGGQSAWDTLVYESVPLKELFVYPLQFYANRALYYADIVAALLDTHKHLRNIVILHTTRGVSHTAGCLAHRELNALADAARLAAHPRDVAVEVLGAPSYRMRRNLLKIFAIAPLELLFAAANSIQWLRPRKKMRILASEYWRHIRSPLECLADAELVLLDRGEIRAAGTRNWWRYRMRFFHLSAWARASISRRELAEAWQGLCSEKVFATKAREEPVSALLLGALIDIESRALPLVCRDIDGAWALVDAIDPSVVLLRASVSMQWHFAILALVARARVIPSIELQHGLEYLGPGSISRRHTAEYIAVYGPLIRDELMQISYASDKLPLVGSPRFDAHAPQAEPRREIVCIAPDLGVSPGFDSFEIGEYFAAAGAAARAARMPLIIKLRPGQYRRNFYEQSIRNACAGVEYRIAEYEPLEEILRHAWCTLSCYSTAVLESLQNGVPVVLICLASAESLMARWHFARYEAQGVLRIADDAPSLVGIMSALDAKARADMQEAGRLFLAAHYRFDGQASERLAQELSLLAAPRA